MKEIVVYLLLFMGVTAHAQTFQLSDSTFKEGDKLVTHSIIFDFNKPSIRPESYAYLDSVVDFLTAHPHLKIEIGNHCDERWSDSYSTCLTCKRAHAVRAYLIDKGINEERLTSKGYNDHLPIIVNAKTEEEHTTNRRTEFMIVSVRE